MSRKWRDWRGTRGPSDEELDELLASTWEVGGRVVARVLDLEAGKAALLAGEPWHAGAGGALGVALLEIDELAARITARLAEGVPSLLGAPLHITQLMLVQLRGGLAGRSLGRPEAEQLLARADHALDQGEWSMRHQGPLATSPAAVEAGELLADLRAAVQRLGGQVEWLFDDADEISVLAPVQ
jgi:hypothetical protein